jgi:23S rRNA (adenine2503-C2)-methyltransferase
MNLNDVQEVLTELKQPKYRLAQIKKAVYGQLVEHYSDIEELPKELRDALGSRAPLLSFRDAKLFPSQSNDSVKALFTLRDGLLVESVLMYHNNDRITLCVSSQVGCPMQCGFCATGKLGFKRNLTTEEITDQVLYFNRYLKNNKRSPVGNVVFMGMGEPFLNYDNVIGAVRLLNDHDVFNIGQRHISVSTAGVVPGIRKFADEKLQVNLAISLHATSDTVRSRIMPVNKQYSIAEIMASAREYADKTNRRLMFEYLLIDGLNDSEEDAQRLAKMMSENKLYFVNLIIYNETGIFNPPSKNKIEAFKKILQSAGIDVIQRRKFGEDIGGACGQLAAQS